MNALAHIVRILMIVIYAPMKCLCKTDPCKVVLLSRQSNYPSIDLQLTLDRIHKTYPCVKTVVITRRVERSVRSNFAFMWAQVMSLYQLATARVAILESYWPAVSAVNHKEGLTVIQLWHSLGKIKKSGLQTVGKAQGWSQKVAGELRMHSGYDYVVAGAKAWNPAYCASFGIDENQILNIGLPRADHLLHERQNSRRAILQQYPELDDGLPIVLYAPTFRRHHSMRDGVEGVVASLDLDNCHLVVKGHANQPLASSSSRIVECREFSGMELLTIADLLITDYSAIAIEAALLSIKTLYYLYDYVEYTQQNGLNLDLPKEFPELVAQTETELQAKVNTPYPIAAFERYRSKYLFDDPGHSTADLVDALEEKGRLCQSL